MWALQGRQSRVLAVAIVPAQESVKSESSYEGDASANRRDMALTVQDHFHLSFTFLSSV